MVFNTVFTNEDFWFTAKDKFIYLICLSDSVTDQIRVKSLLQYKDQIKSIKMLGNKGVVKWDTSSDKLLITLPTDQKDLDGFVLKIQLK